MPYFINQQSFSPLRTQVFVFFIICSVDASGIKLAAPEALYSSASIDSMVVLMEFFRQLLHQHVGDQAGGDHSPEAPPSISQLL